MPRACIFKASTAVRRVIPHERSFDLTKQPTVIERVAARIFEIIMNCGQEAAVIDVFEDIVTPLVDRAPIFKDRNGKRIKQAILQAVARLTANGYIEYLPHTDEFERFRITIPFQTIIQELIEKLIATCPDNFRYNAIEHHRFNCCFFRAKFRRNFKRNPTRRELDLENRRLIFQATEHSRVCPMEQIRSRSVATEATEIFDPSITQPPPVASHPNINRDDGDSMYVDDVPNAGNIASGSGLQPPKTPVRRSFTLNSAGAYPSPESLERTVSVAPLTPEETPSRSRSVTTAVGSDDDTLSDIDVDVDALGDDPPRIPGALFLQAVPSGSESPHLRRLVEEHEEELAAIRIECDEKLHAKDMECDARLAAQGVEHQDELTVKDRWWSRKLALVRKFLPLPFQLQCQESERRLNHHIARSRRKDEKIQTLEEEKERKLRELQETKEQLEQEREEVRMLKTIGDQQRLEIQEFQNDLQHITQRAFGITMLPS